MPQKYQKIPQELWDKITPHLPSLTTRHAAKVLSFGLWPSQESHSGVWDAIIEDPSWIHKAIADFQVNPILIGQNLHNCVNSSNKSAYLTLIVRDNSGELRSRKEDFLKSLRGRPKLNTRNEVYFPSSKITLNVADLIRSFEVIPADTKRLFSHRYKSLQSAYLLWNDPEHKVRTIDSEDIVGIGGRAFTLRNVSFICGLSVTFSDGHREQYVLETTKKGARDVRLIGSHKRGLNEECAGWRWIDISRTIRDLSPN
jgi:hypothetical protein